MSEMSFCCCNFDMGISYTPIFLSESIVYKLLCQISMDHVGLRYIRYWKICTDVVVRTSIWSDDDNKFVEFFRIHMLLTPLRLVLALQYLTNPYFVVLSSLVRRHDKSFVVHLLEPADVCMGIYAIWESSTDMADFDLPQTFPIPLTWWTGCDSSRLFQVSHLLGYMLGHCCLHCLFPTL